MGLSDKAAKIEPKAKATRVTLPRTVCAVERFADLLDMLRPNPLALIFDYESCTGFVKNHLDAKRIIPSVSNGIIKQIRQ